MPHELICAMPMQNFIGLPLEYQRELGIDLRFYLLEDGSILLVVYDWNNGFTERR